MAPFAAALLSALAAVTCIQAVPTLSTRNNINGDSHHVERQSGAGPQRNFYEFEGWNTYKAYGSNLGAWFEIETTNTPNIWIDGGANVTDEWTFCETVGKKRCGEVLEEHYRTYITNATIDKLATVDVNTLRIPMTYAAWVKVPGSNLYSGNQQKYLREVTNYAISTYGMHVIIGLHSLPGGLNTLEIGEAFGRNYWFYNETNLNYSLQAVDSILDFIQSSIAPDQFTISPLNEPTDNFTNFASPESVSYPRGVEYVTAYTKAVYAKMQAVNPNLWLMQNDAFGGASRWTPYWSRSDKWLVEEHVYYFAVPGVYADTIPGRVCNETLGRRIDGGDFPIFVGEFSLQAQLGNTFAGRQAIYDSQVRAFQQYLSGGTFWTARFEGFDPVIGEGTQNDYWYFNKLIDEGVIRSYSEVNSTDYCRG